MKAKDIMTTPVVTIEPDTTVREIAALLLERRISGVPVVEAGRLVGLVSEGDLLQDVHAALSVADRGYVMETGEIVREGTAKELKDDPEVQRAYLGEITVCTAKFGGVERAPN